ncbi:MAG: Asp-tRNA(Asn)/Glu-tRNA(Gln) amidotransferase GatCAB subunit B, partial [bacterium]|nr:Asp-tRNA(Asn)/Glu-tRNA(Gln) amidotransferase GatCAB subunit B [bacterium]
GIRGSKASAVDFNRCGVPLIEIVSEPNIHNAREAREYVVMLRSILVSLGLCNGNLEEGSLRCDANISIRKHGESEPGVKTEIKNMNSFKAIERSIDVEIERQKRMKRKGLDIHQETRGWDESSQSTYIMRSKEESHDYRYFPDPDLVPLILDEVMIEKLRSRLKELPLERKKRFQEQCSLNNDESKLLILNPHYGDYFEEMLKHYDNPRNAANWFFNELLSYIAGNIRDIHIEPEDFTEFLKKIDCGDISGKIGKSVIKKSFENEKCLNDIINEEDLKQITDHKTIE